MSEHRMTDHLGATVDADARWAEPIDGGVLDVEPSDYFSDTSATLGDRVSAARQAAGLTQSGLAARLGVSAKIVSSWENDRSEPRANRLAMLAGLLNVSVSWLLTGGGEGVSPPEPTISAAPHPISLRVRTVDLDEARRFYGDLLGCALEPATPAADEAAFQFFGHRLVAAAGGEAAALDLVIELSWAEWESLTERLRSALAEFRDEPEIRSVGGPDEHAMLRLADPSGNSIGFWARRNQVATAQPAFSAG